MANLQELQLELETKRKEVRTAQKTKMDIVIAAQQAEEDAKLEDKNDEEKALYLQAKIDAATAKLAELQS
jgi:hypothetical protein